MPTFTLAEIQKSIPDAEIMGTDTPEEILIETVCSINQNKTNSISFLSSKKFIQNAINSTANALFTSKNLAEGLSKPLLVVKNVDMTLIALLNLLHPEPAAQPKISPSATIHPSVSLGKNITIGDYVVIGENTIIGDNCIIGSGSIIEQNVKIGNDCKIGANNVFHRDVVIGNRFVSFGNSTFGSDGFRFVPANGKYLKVPHIGRLVFGDDIEVGSNCSFDRGVLEDTIIGDYCKFDNQVHIAHNCKIGKNTLIAANSAVAGSTILGDNIIIGGCSAIADHLEIASNTVIAGGTGIRNSIEKSDIYAGAEFGLNFANFQKLRVNIKHIVNFQNWIKRIKNLEKDSEIND